MFIQFGYVVLFSSAFPLAALCALLNNVIEIRSDAFKLCTNLRRPFGERVENIGTWQVTLNRINLLSETGSRRTNRQFFKPIKRKTKPIVTLRRWHVFVEF